MKSLKNVLGKPTPQMHPWANWIWNGNVTPEKIISQFKGLVDASISGIIIRPSADMVPQFLSDEFYAHLDIAVNLAKEHSLPIRIYDDLSLRGCTTFASAINQSSKLRAQKLVLEQSIVPSERDDLTLNIDNPETAIVLDCQLCHQNVMTLR